MNLQVDRLFFLPIYQGGTPSGYERKYQTLLIYGSVLSILNTKCYSAPFHLHRGNLALWERILNSSLPNLVKYWARNTSVILPMFDLFYFYFYFVIDRTLDQRLTHQRLHARTTLGRFVEYQSFQYSLQLWNRFPYIIHLLRQGLQFLTDSTMSSIVEKPITSSKVDDLDGAAVKNASFAKAKTRIHRSYPVGISLAHDILPME